MAPLIIREPSEVGGGPGGWAGSMHANPSSELGGTERTHAMSPQEIGVMVGIILIFSALIGSLFYFRARKIKKKKADLEAAAVAVAAAAAAAAADKDCDRPVTRDSIEEEDSKGQLGVPEASSGSFMQLFGNGWPGVMGGSNQTGDISLVRLRP
ncbi:uncharacterized protein DNG_02836 [Cephalotrichum gorgonifer]|uniref:Uncharacterized protein n=1 Tax=Cephalotrichum gorgonifer TaxID=2041049 RepID=A0AAE8ST31_9PEZI|nr:uncharacterized protein DNG_02836 [Cephalotrichum gorgonifer]